LQIVEPSHARGHVRGDHRAAPVGEPQSLSALAAPRRDEGDRARPGQPVARVRNWQQRRRAQAAEEARKRASRMRESAPGRQLHWFGERGWWEVTLAPVAWRHEIYIAPDGERRTRYVECGRDVVLAAGFSKLTRHELYGRDHVYATEKRQLKSKEIAKLGLPR